MGCGLTIITNGTFSQMVDSRLSRTSLFRWQRRPSLDELVLKGSDPVSCRFEAPQRLQVGPQAPESVLGMDGAESTVSETVYR